MSFPALKLSEIATSRSQAAELNLRLQGHVSSKIEEYWQALAEEKRKDRTECEQNLVKTGTQSYSCGVVHDPEVSLGQIPRF